MYTFDSRRVDEDLEPRAWLGQDRYARRVELERHVASPPAGFVGAEEVRAQHRLKGGEEAAKDAVLVQAGHGVDRLLDLGRDLRRLVGVAAVRIKAGHEQPHEHGRDVRMTQEGPLHVAVREGDPALTQILRNGADDGDIPRVQGRGEDKAVEAVVLELAPPHAQENVLEDVPDPLHVLGPEAQTEVVDPHRRGVPGRDLVRALVHHLGPEVLEGGKNVGQRHST